MFRALIRFCFFTIPMYFVRGLELIIFDDHEIMSTQYEFTYRAEEKLSKQVETLNSIIEQDNT